ncbi:MAG: protein phosphatase 2C domain-containing protein [Planctomycetia bacterium]|nr:protein phosphatase 2C domain-containing protein [Planctomycetia bacterium]
MQNPAGYWQDFIEYAELTDVGLRRANNQDSKACMLAGTEVDFFRRGHLFMVADGMGRHAAGELASKISVDTVPLEYFKQPDAPAPTSLKFALAEGNRRIFERGSNNPDFKGMGTTTSVLVLLPQGAMCGHVGDSRVYRLRGNRLEQLTFDHSVVWEMRAAAKSTGTEVPDHIPKNYITRSLGHDPNVQIDLEGPFPLVPGDTFMLCSDGLSGQVEDDEIGALLGCLTPQEAVQTFVDLANLRGGPDNITVVVVKVLDLSRVKNAVPPKMPARGDGSDSVSPFVWAGIGVTALLGAMLSLTGKTIPGLASTAVAVLLGLFAFAKGTSGRSVRAWRGGELGRGPHTSLVCPVNEEFLDKLSALTTRLRETAVQQKYQINWQQYDRTCETAIAAKKSADLPGAVRRYCYALNFLMNELRRQRTQKQPESTILDD